MYSIRNKLNFTIIASMIVLLSISASFLYLRIVDHVEQVFDGALFDKAQALISLTELDEEGLEFDFAEEGVMLEFQQNEAPQYYQLWENEVDLLIKSPSLAESDLRRMNTDFGDHQFADLQLPDGRAGRLIEINFMPRAEVEDDEEDEDYGAEISEPQPITMVFARERESLDQTLFTIGATIFGFILMVLGNIGTDNRKTGQGSNKFLVKNIPEDLVINTDRDKLGMILGNLFVNAVSYSPDCRYESSRLSSGLLSPEPRVLPIEKLQSSRNPGRHLIRKLSAEPVTRPFSFSTDTTDTNQADRVTCDRSRK